MTDPTAPLADTPANTPTSDTPEIPWQKRYEDLRPEFDRTTQTLRQLENDRDAYIALGQKHGFEFEFEELAAPAQQPGADPAIAQTQAELAELRQWKTEVENERQQRQFDEGRQAVRSQHDEWAKEAGIKLAGFDHDAIIQRALESGATTLDDAKQVFDAYVAHKQGEREALEAEIREQMKRPRVPHTPGGGTADTGVPDFTQMSDAEALAWQVERVRGINAAQ